jgi:hypothetical protein
VLKYCFEGLDCDKSCSSVPEKGRNARWCQEGSSVVEFSRLEGLKFKLNLYPEWLRLDDWK